MYAQETLILVNVRLSVVYQLTKMFSLTTDLCFIPVGLPPGIIL